MLVLVSSYVHGVDSTLFHTKRLPLLRICVSAKLTHDNAPALLSQTRINLDGLAE